MPATAKEMDFELDVVDLRPMFDLYQWVFADGDLVEGTAKRFALFAEKNGLRRQATTIYFNSSGGSVVAGMELGDRIREFGFKTDVGIRGNSDEKIVSGSCLSACVLSYLGGEYRYLGGESVLGIHQFAFSEEMAGEKATQVSQVLAGLIVTYLDRSRVNPDFFRRMTETLPDEMYLLPPDELAEMRIVTGDVYSESWSFQMTAGTAYLKGEQVTYRGENKLILYCSPESNLTAVVLSEIPYAQSVIDSHLGVVVFVDGTDILIPDKSVTQRPKITGAFVAWEFEIPTDVGERMRNAGTLGSGLVPPSREIFAGFDGLRVDDDGRKKLLEMLDSCR